MHTRSFLWFVVLFCMIFCSCKKSDPLYRESVDSASSDLVCLINSDILNLRKLACCYLAEDKLFSYDERKGSFEPYQLSFESGTILRFQKNLSSNIGIPSVSMVYDNGAFLWTLNDELILDDNGTPIKVQSSGDVPELTFDEGFWSCRIGSQVLTCTAKTYSSFVSFEEDELGRFLLAFLPTGCTIVIVKSSCFYSPFQQVANNAFYKNIFMDAGVGLTNRKKLAAAQYLGLQLESMSFPSSEFVELQNQLIEGDSVDLNGRLLYPDGQPRYQLLFVNGGNAMTHGQSLSEKSRDNMRTFYNNGGSYCGTCAGAFFATRGAYGPTVNQYYLQIWPGFVRRTHLSQSHTGFFIEPDSPLLNYYDFGGDYYIENIRHNGGCYADVQPLGGEVLARYDYPAVDSMHLQPSAWAYKGSSNTGRIILIGSHPEEIWSGEGRDFTAASLLYAIDGRGRSTIKGILQNGIKREMVKSTIDNDPDYTMIGDLQCHHFVFFVPENAVWVNVSLKSEADVDMTLMLNQGTYAYPESAQFVSSGDGSDHDFTFQNLTPGIWYVGVQCNTTVTTTETSWGQEYSGRTDVLNGVPYSIKVSWTTPQVATVLKVLDR